MSHSSSSSILLNLFGRRVGSDANISVTAASGERCTANVNESASTTQGVAQASCADEAGALPDLAGLERTRAKKRKPPEGPRGRAAAGRTTKETTVSIVQRLREFPDQGLRASAGKIFCAPCREEQPNLKESLKRHISTQKHKDKLEAYLQAENVEGSLARDIAVYFVENPDQKGASTSTEKHTFRYKLVESFLISGTPLSRLHFFEPMLTNAISCR